MFTIQRPYVPIQHPYITKPNFQIMENNNNLHDEKSSYNFSMLPINLGRKNPTQIPETNRINNTSQKAKIEEKTFHIAGYGDQKGKARWSYP